MCGHNVLGRFVMSRDIWRCISEIPIDLQREDGKGKFVFRMSSPEYLLKIFKYKFTVLDIIEY